MSISTDQGVDVEAGLEFQILSHLKVLSAAEKERQDQERSGKGQVLDALIMGSGVSANTGDLVFSCDGPALGRIWFLRRLGVTAGGSPINAATGAAYFFTSTDINPNQLLYPTWFGLLATLPNVLYLSNEHVLIRHPMKVIVLIHGPAANTTYTCGGFAVDAHTDTTKKIGMML